MQIFPPLFVLDSTTMKHYVLALANIGSICFLLFYTAKKQQGSIHRSIFANKMNYAFLLLIAFMIVSMLQSMNIVESIVVLNRWLIVYMTFVFLAIFLNKKPSLINLLVGLNIAVALFNVAWCIIAYYYLGVNVNPRKNLWLNGFYGNKNIFAVALLFKLPLLYYAFLFRKRVVKWLGLALVYGVTFCLVILSARATFLGLIENLVIIVAYALYSFFYLKKGKEVLTNSLCILIFALCGFFAGNAFIKYNFNQYTAHSYVVKQFTGLNEESYAVSTRFKSIEDGNSKGRLKIWHNTWHIIKEKPILGYGVGNHKLAIMKVEAAQKPGYIVSDHAHNDFLEMWSELGIFGLIAYILLYLSAFWLFIKTQLKRHLPDSTRFASLMGAMILVSYINDALFNFPLERGDCQMYLALALALILFAYIKTYKRNETQNTKRYILYIIAIVSIPIIVIESLHYTSSIMQKAKILQTNGDTTISITGEEWETYFPKIPNIDENTNPIALTIAMRYDRDGDRVNALRVALADNSNPYYALKEYRIANYYYKLNKLDSCALWANKCIVMKPLCYEPVRLFYYMHYQQGDYKGAVKVVENFLLRYKSEEKAWVDLLNAKQRYASSEEISITCDSALYYFPDNTSFIAMKQKSNEIKR